MIIVVPKLKWASNIILNGTPIQELAERAMSVFYSAQDGAPKDADVHRSGFTTESLKGLVERLGCFEDIEVHTTEGNYGNWDDPRYLNKKDMGYNVILIAKKEKHPIPISIKLPIKEQEKAMFYIEPKANFKKKPKKAKKKTKKKTKKK